MENYYLKKLYYEMLRIRCVEEMICEEYPKQEMRCPVHLSIGQEASLLEFVRHCKIEMWFSVLIVLMLIIWPKAAI